MAYWYRTHDLFVFPTLFEGDPLTLREAMAAGMAIVTTDMFPMKEILVAGKTALLVPPGDSVALADAVCRLIEEPGLARRLGENARLASRTRTWDDVARDVAEALA
jgi:glycosyltransferase involved in cell wall biosynthesis